MKLIRFLLLFFFVTLGVMFSLLNFILNFNARSYVMTQKSKKFNESGIHTAENKASIKIKYDPIYGHLHIAKTAGSTINRNFSLNFQNVCGHKGYSYDAIASLKREKSNFKKDDLYSKYYKSRSWIQVPFEIMEEIGYESCKWISHETSWEFWTARQKWPLPMELHVPCREPIDHLMSLSNQQDQPWKCTMPWKQQVDDILKPENRAGYGRFSEKLLQVPELNVKCVRFENVISGQYFDSMKHRLEKRRVTDSISIYHTNPIRKRRKECIWNDVTTLQKIRQYMTSTDEYYKWCASCVGSNREFI